MAFVQTVLTPEPRIFGFAGLPENVQDRSAVPRAEVVFSEIGAGVTAQIPVATGGDTQGLFLRFTLPLGFAYALTYVSLFLDGADCADWDDVAIGFLQDDNVVGIRSIRAGFAMRSYGETGDAVASSLKVWEASNHLPDILALPQPQAAQGVSVICQISNQVADGTAMNVDAYARFLMYDVAQAHNYAVNTPTLVR